MPPRRRTTAAAPRPTTPDVVVVNRKVTRTFDVITTFDAAVALTRRAEQDLAQAPSTFEVERIAGPRDTSARFRFNIPGPMLVVSESDLPIIEALITQLKEEREQS